MKIGVFGGTFDPVHNGHLQLARNARLQFSLDKVLFIPTYRSPHKGPADRSASPEHRYEMVRLATEGEPFLEVSNIELERKGVSYTFDTLVALERAYPGAKLFLIMGKDTFEKIDTWHRAEELKKKACFLVAKRPGHKAETANGPACAAWIDMPLCPISASGVRAALKQGRKVDDDVPPKVLRYIREHSLYQDADR